MISQDFAIFLLSLDRQYQTPDVACLKVLASTSIRLFIDPCSSHGKESVRNTGDPVLILGPEDPLEKGMASHSSILPKRSPWTEEPGGIQSMGHEELDITE